tara:strand:+ start:45 stop:734 length:690 start_codon:yes stop_codon:yes gene_type:complete
MGKARLGASPPPLIKDLAPDRGAWTARMRGRASRAVETLGSAAEAIGPLSPGLRLFLLTRGQFSMLDMVLHVLNETGPANISVWTWAIADYEVQAMGGLMGSAGVQSGRLVVDRSAEQRSAGTVADWRTRFGVDTVRVCKNHAKIARVWNDKYRVLLRGSMNLNYNPRFEQADVSEGGEDFDLVERVENELPILEPMCRNVDADNASGLGLAHERASMPMFSGVKTWAK